MSNKSDYRRSISPVTLAPFLQNPWRNPMKSGIVSPAYDSSETINYKYGPSLGAVGNPTSSVGWDAVDGTYGNADGGHFLVWNYWGVQPGAKTINSVRAHIGVSNAANATGMFVEVWREDTDVFTLVAQSENFGGAGPAGWGVFTLTPSGGLDVELESGKKYYVGVRVVRTDNNAAAPVAARSDTGTGFTYGYKLIGVAPAAWNGATLPKASVADEVTFAAAASSVMQLEIDYDSSNYLELSVATGVGKRFLIPVAVTAPYVVKMETVVVPDAGSLTILIQDVTNNSAFTLQETGVLDFGATDQVTSQTNDVALAASLGETTFDLWYAVRPADGEADLFFAAYGATPPAPISHACANASTRGTRYSYTFGRSIYLESAAGTVATVVVGVKPLVLLGDSNVYTTTGLNTDRLGGLPAAMTKPRVWLPCGKSGADWSYVRNALFAAAVGAGDGVEMLGMQCLWIGCGMGVNAVAGAAKDSYDDTRKWVCDQIEDVGGLFRAVTDADTGERIMLIGAPPYSHTDADKYEAAMVRWMNRAYLGIALALQIPFYNPWPDVVERGTEGNDIPTFDATYSTDGLHYIAAGGALVCASAVEAFESGTIDLRDAWD